MTDLGDSLGTSHSHVSLKEGKNERFIRCLIKIKRQRKVKGTSGVLASEPDKGTEGPWSGQRTSSKREDG